MTTISFTVLGHPTGKGRPRACRRGAHIGLYTPAKTEEAERSLLAQSLPYKPAQPLGGPLSVSIELLCAVPKSWSKRKRNDALYGYIHPTGKPDVDNAAKLVLDALNGVFYVDDKQVVELSVSKRYDDTPSTVISIRQLT